MAHRSDPHKLFCQLTATNLNKNKACVEKHVGGKRFKKAKAEFEKLVEEDADYSFRLDHLLVYYIDFHLVFKSR